MERNVVYIPQGHRRAIVMFRSGVGPLLVDIGRYNNMPLRVRVCFSCLNVVEDEMHVLLYCPFISVFYKMSVG